MCIEVYRYLGLIPRLHSCMLTIIDVYLKAEDFEPYFSGQKKLLPHHSDLSFYNWDTNYSTSNSTVNYQVSLRMGGGRGREKRVK